MDERTKGTERSDDQKDVAEIRPQTFTCTGEACLVTEPAEEMFNLSCDPLRCTMKELREKIRCRSCAEEIARKRGKHLGEPGCSVYPLAQTLRTRERGAGAVPVGGDVPTYVCKEGDCGTKGSAVEMFNLQAGHKVKDLEALSELVRCNKHALEIATSRGFKLCEPGSGIYRLSYTLRLLGIGPARTLQEQRDNEYRRWVEDGLRKRERKEREDRIKAYAIAYAESPLLDELSPGTAKPQPKGGDNGYFCGIPLECCRHDEPVHRFITVMGQVVGICDMVARIFTEVHKDHEATNGMDQRYRRLLSTADFEQASAIASRWFEREYP